MPDTIDPMKQQQGVALQELRNKHNLNQRTVATEVAVTTSAVSAWETGKTRPGIETMAKLDALYGSAGDVFKIYGAAPGGPSLGDVMAKLDALQKGQRGVRKTLDEMVSLLETLAGVEAPSSGSQSDRADEPSTPPRRRR